jgi:GT2 family glycosyltransferase
MHKTLNNFRFILHPSSFIPPAARRLFAPRALGLADLIPWKDVEPGDVPGAWRVRGPEPQFVLPGPVRAGWLRVRLTLTAASPGWLGLYAGGGFEPAECLQRVAVQERAEVDCFVRVPGPAAALRIDPPDGPGEFRLEGLRVEPLSAPRALGEALAAKVRLLRKYAHTRQALWRAAGLLLRGDFGRLREKLFRGMNGPDLEGREPYDEGRAYEAWRRRRALTDADRERLRAEAAALADPPRFSVLLPLSAGREVDVRRSVESVLRQTYPGWELCVSCDASAGGSLRSRLAEFAQNDPRVRVVESPVAGDASAANAALAAATGDYVTLLDEGDELAEAALSRLAAAAAADRGLQMLYADEDRVAEDGRHVAPFLKPGWSPDTLLAWQYTGRPCVYRTDVVRRLGGFRAEFDPAHEYDLVLRIAADSPHVARVPDVLYHRRGSQVASERADEAARAALRAYLGRTGREGTAEPGPRPGLHQVRFSLRGAPVVSVVIPSACRPASVRGKTTFFLAECLERLRRSTYRNVELVVLHGPEVPPELARRLDEWGAVRAAYAAPFSWARAMNQSAALARGEHLLFLNDDVEVITPDWVERLLEFSQQPEVGAVGAKLLFPSGRVQHAGVAVLGGRPLHPFYSFGGGHGGYFHSLLVPRNCSAVTGACLMTRTEVFRSLGGFEEALPLNYNDVDYCLRVIRGGRRVVCTPHARLYHHELGTRKPEVRPEEAEFFRRSWGAAWADDPYYNPNLSTKHLDYRIREDAAA